ncbi:PREDICTED: transmembrane protein 256 homolog [Habropoda laboriosa]|uniref:transmembrane protein 256 homolog n=1 Tax=Habropoda laboriosa TaxID=597456 RepID=UPI00083D7B91|nr:PREDICTED: transmembrane protein 256 homolog [Habropoda laboriosa]
MAYIPNYIWGTAVAAKDYLILAPKAEAKMTVPLWKLAAASGPFIKIAALSGATAVSLGAYGSHRQYPEENKQDLKQVFETASRYHFIHTLAMLGLPLCRTPYLSGAFLLSGIVLFCGTCYYYAFTGDNQWNKLTPIGGVCFIMGWLSMCI